MIYLDYAATNPFTKYPCSKYGQFLNPNANYAYKEQKLLTDCASRVKAAIGAKSGKVVFGGTSSQLIENLMNWEINGKRRFTEYVIGSKYEHDSFNKFLVTRVANIDQLMNTIAKNRGYRGCVIWQGVNNITGEIFPVEQIGTICHWFNLFYICDMTAMIGKAKIPANIDQWCDCAIWSGHKLGTEGGIGAMWLSDKFNEWLGDFKLHGTPNLTGAMAITDATENACKSPMKHYTDLYMHLYGKLVNANVQFQVISDRLKTCAINAIMFDDINADSLQQYLASKQIYIGIGGSACSSLHDFRVLNACGLINNEASRVVRVSFGDETTERDIDAFVNAVIEYKEKFVR